MEYIKTSSNPKVLFTPFSGVEKMFTPQQAFKACQLFQDKVLEAGNEAIDPKIVILVDDQNKHTYAVIDSNNYSDQLHQLADRTMAVTSLLLQSSMKAYKYDRIAKNRYKAEELLCEGFDRLEQGNTQELDKLLLEANLALSLAVALIEECNKEAGLNLEESAYQI